VKISDEDNGDVEGYAERELAILTWIESNGSGVHCQDLKMRRMDQYLDLRRNTLYWLRHAEDEESIDLLLNMFQSPMASGIAPDIVMVIGIHDTPGKVVPVLDDFACGPYSSDIRENAIFWLGQQKTENALESLGKVLDREPVTDLRKKVVFALYCHGSDGAVTKLNKTARDDQNQDVRKEAIFWLGQMATVKTLDVLSDIAIDAKETEIQEQAVFAISQHADSEAVPLLIRIARAHRNPEVRKKAIFWLGQTGDDRALEFFVELLRDK
jgi:HEAT repeat protein